MDSASLDQYEEQLYAVFKTFDVDNAEALSRSAVLALCDALQLEARGAALVDSLFERRAQRVTFAQFRSGLLAVLGAEPAPEPTTAADPAPDPSESVAGANTPAELTHSDDDSSGREVAPKFVFGSKKYGRRSRPQRATSAPDEASSNCGRTRCKRSASAAGPHVAETPPPASPLADPDLDHDSRIDCEGALELCRHLRMDGIDRRLVERIFEAAPTAETTVGEFFDRLNASLSTSIASACESGAIANEAADDGALPGELVAETWERAGVQRPRRLLAELGFGGAAVHAPALERALDEELRALAEPADARALLLQAALALSRLRHARAQHSAAATAAERDRLRADLAESNRRARVLAQEVDENHARLEAELTANLRRAEARHTEATRATEAALAAERERAAAERAALEGEVSRRAEAEARARADAASLRRRTEETEARAVAAEERAAAAERDRARLTSQLREATAYSGPPPDAPDANVLASRLDELRAENKVLRDRCDELCCELEARGRRGDFVAAGGGDAASWRDEARGAERVPPLEICDSPLASLEQDTGQECAATKVEAGVQVETAAVDEADTLRVELNNLTRRHDDEKAKLSDLVKELEASLEQMKVEYERCEEYWSTKLAEERDLSAAEQRASDERLADLIAKIGEYERQFAPPTLPTIDEKYSLERQVADLEDEFAAYRSDRDRELAEKDAEMTRLRDRIAVLEQAAAARAAAAPSPSPHAQRETTASAPPGGEERRRQHAPAFLAPGVGWRCACAGAEGGRAAAALRARLARAEAAVARLTARLAAADLLVKELYVENCLLGPRRP